MANHESLRFATSVAVILSLGCIPLLLIGLINYSTVLYGICCLIASLFLQTWFSLHGDCLTRCKRALFNETNILQTYQPRAREIGHLFEPEPPTPVPNEEGRTKEQDAFRAKRDAHYANEFAEIERLTKERELMKTDEKKQSSEDGKVVRVELSDNDDSDEPKNKGVDL